MSAAKILIVDDEPDIVWSVRYTLADEGYDVVTAASGNDALAVAHESHPDLVIMDFVLPDADGAEVCHAFRRDQHLAAVPIIFLSQRCSVADKVRGLNCGADDYIAKPFDFGELKARIGALLRRAGRGRPGPAPVTQLVCRDLRLDLRTHRVTVGRQAILLTPVEFDLLRFLLAHQGQVFSGERLLQEVWHDEDQTRDLGMVRWHVMRLRGKIEPDPARPTYLRTVPRHGYMLGGPEA
jgi:DNA-binding response OmpR family regulator